MKKNTLPMIVVLVVIGLLIIGYFMKGKGSLNKDQVKVTVGGEVKEDNFLSGKIQDLIASGRSIKCTYAQDKNNNSVIYIKGKDFSGDFISNGKIGHMIYKDSCSWIWSDGEVQGVTMCSKEASKDQNNAFKGIENVPQNVNFNCQPLIGGDDKFTPPAAVNFTDLSGFTKPQ